MSASSIVFDFDRHNYRVVQEFSGCNETSGMLFIVQSESNQTRLTLIVGRLVPQRGAPDPEYMYDAEHNIYKHTSRNKYSVSDRMSRTLNRNECENKLGDKNIKRIEESKILRCRADS